MKRNSMVNIKSYGGLLKCGGFNPLAPYSCSLCMCKPLFGKQASQELIQEFWNEEKIPESHQQRFRVVDPLPWIKLAHWIAAASISLCTNKPMLSQNNMMLLNYMLKIMLVAIKYNQERHDFAVNTWQPK